MAVILIRCGNGSTSDCLTNTDTASKIRKCKNGLRVKILKRQKRLKTCKSNKAFTNV